MKLIRRYRVFIILVIVQILLQITLPQIGNKSLSNIKQNIQEMILVIPPIFILLGLLDVWIDRQTMMKYTGKDAGIKGTIIAFILGSVAAGPLYAAFPVAVVMIKKGAWLFNVFVFIGAWSTTKIPMLTFEASSLGLYFTAVRLCFSVIGIIVIALILVKVIDENEIINNITDEKDCINEKEFK